MVFPDFSLSAEYFGPVLGCGGSMGPMVSSSDAAAEGYLLLG